MDKPSNERGSTGPTDGIKAEGDAGNERHICKANPAMIDDIGEKTWPGRYVRKFFRQEICFGTESSYQIP